MPLVRQLRRNENRSVSLNLDQVLAGRDFGCRTSWYCLAIIPLKSAIIYRISFYLLSKQLTTLFILHSYIQETRATFKTASILVTSSKIYLYSSPMLNYRRIVLMCWIVKHSFHFHRIFYLLSENLQACTFYLNIHLNKFHI